MSLCYDQVQQCATLKQTYSMQRYVTQKGYVVISVIVFGAVFAVILGGLTGFIFIQNSSQRIKDNRTRATQIAEAGIDYYKWFLAHFPGDIYNGEGASSTGPYVIEYEDPETGTIGTFELDIAGETVCDQITSVEITSTGYTSERPDIQKEIYARYARPSVAQYSYIINGNVWFDESESIAGPVHANGGVRMDGLNYSVVTSGVDNWLCTSNFGCSPDTTQNGVFGTGTNPHLWKYPVPQIDFAGITTDIVELKDLAQTSGYYHAPTSKSGYLVDFLSNGTFDVHRVNETGQIWNYNEEDGWVKKHERITQNQFVGNFSTPPDCTVAFFEDNVWVQGEVNGKYVIVSADLINPGVDTTVYLVDDITYVNGNGEDGLTVIAEKDVLIPLESPDEMVLHGIFVAQNGRFGRNRYNVSNPNKIPAALADFATRTSLAIVGTVVSNDPVQAKWFTGTTFDSGYATRTIAFDRDLTTAPPPFTPTFDDNFTFVEWREEL